MCLVQSLRGYAYVPLLMCLIVKLFVDVVGNPYSINESLPELILHIRQDLARALGRRPKWHARQVSDSRPRVLLNFWNL